MNFPFFGAQIIRLGMFLAFFWFFVSARAQTDITTDILASNNINLNGDSVINLPAGISTYNGIISGNGSITINAPGGAAKLVVTQDSTFNIPLAQQTLNINQVNAFVYYQNITNPNPAGVVVNPGATLQFGMDVSSTTGTWSDLRNATGGSINALTLQVDGTIALSGGPSYRFGSVTGSGLITQPGFANGNFDFAGDSSFSGVISEFSGGYLGSPHRTFTMPNVKAIFNNGSLGPSVPAFQTITLKNNFYENHFGDDINFGGFGRIILSGVYSYTDGPATNPSLSNPILNYRLLPGNASYRGLNMDGGGVIQFGDGTTNQIFLPSTRANAYIIMNGPTLAFNYNGPVSLYVSINAKSDSNGILNPTPGSGNVDIMGTQGNDVTFAAPQFYNGTTTIGQGATLRLGQGSNTSIISVDNLGQAVKTITVSGDGSLLTAESVGGKPTNKIVNDGLLVVNNIDTAISLSNISGTGSFEQQGTATVSLLHDTTYTGHTTISRGILAIGTGGGISSSTGVTLRNGGTFDISQGGDQLVKDLSSETGTTVALGANTLTLGTANDRTFAGHFTDGGIGGGTGGSIFKQGAGTLTHTGTSTHSGTTTVGEGTLVNDGIFTRSNMVVGGFGRSALLTGTGSYGGSVTVNNGGTFARSGSIGTTNIGGNLTFNSGSTAEMRYESPTVRDQFIASGAVTINNGSTLRITVPGSFTPLAPGQVVPLITGSTVNGNFSSIELPQVAALNFSVVTLDPTVSLVGPGGVPENPAGQPSIPGLPFLSGQTGVGIRVNLNAFDAFAQTVNQHHVASALDKERLSINNHLDSDMRTVIGNFNTLPTGEALRAAFDQVAPLQYASLSTIAFNQANVNGINLRQRMMEIRNGSRGLSGDLTVGRSFEDRRSADITQPASGDPGTRDGNGGGTSLEDPFRQTEDNHWGFFLTGSGDFGRAENSPQISGFDFSTGWLTLGGDYRIDPMWTVGSYMAYAGTDADFGPTGRVGVNSAKFGLYTQWQQTGAQFQDKGGLYAHADLGGAYNAYDLKRKIIFNEINRSAKASPSGTELTTALGTGYDLRLGTFNIGPFAEMRYTRLDVDAFTESGADALSLGIQSQHADSLRFTLGTSGSWNYHLGKIPIRTDARLAWQYEALDASRAINARFAGGAGTAFNILTENADGSSLLAGIGLDAQITPSISTFIHYDTELARNNLSFQQVTTGFRLQW